MAMDKGADPPAVNADPKTPSPSRGDRQHVSCYEHATLEWGSWQTRMHACSSSTTWSFLPTHFGRKKLKAVSNHQSASQKPIARLLATPLEPDLIIVAKSFYTAQELRHTADYDLSRSFSSTEVAANLATIQAAFRSWAAIRGSDNAKVMLTAFVANRRWTR